MLRTLLEAGKNVRAHILVDIESVKFLGDQRLTKSHYKDTNNKVLLE